MDTGIDIRDARLRPVVAGARLERLCTGAAWSEGPVWMHEDDAVLWSDIPAPPDGVRRAAERAGERARVRRGEKVGNLCFGGARRDQLYVAASSSLYRIVLRTEGIQRP